MGKVVLETSYSKTDPLKKLKMQPSLIFHPSNLTYPAFAHTHLPEFESLDRYELPWAVFGCLTYAKTPPLPTTQLKDFLHLMKSVGTLNHSHPDLLHWFARVEHSSSARWHLHFLLGHERVTNGRHTPMSVETVCEFIESQWFHGNAEVTPYDPREDGVGYVTKITDPQLIGETKMSQSLIRLLKKLPHSGRRESEIKKINQYHVEDRDPLTTELVVKLSRTKKSGDRIGFMDEIQREKVA